MKIHFAKRSKYDKPENFKITSVLKNNNIYYITIETKDKYYDIDKGAITTPEYSGEMLKFNSCVYDEEGDCVEDYDEMIKGENFHTCEIVFEPGDKKSYYMSYVPLKHEYLVTLTPWEETDKGKKIKHEEIEWHDK